MNINVVGGGPGGLYFALLMKETRPIASRRRLRTKSYGRNYGWGIVLSDRALSFLQSADADFFTELSAALEIWHDQILVLRGERVAVHGSTFSGMERLAMLSNSAEALRRRWRRSALRLAHL